MLSRSFLAGIAAALLVVLAVTGAQALIDHARPSLTANALDYRVMACAGRVARAGGDPYRVEPLRSCERAAAPEAGEPAWSVTPFTLPGYVLPPLEAVSLLGFRTGKALWLAALALALGVTAAALARVVGARSYAVALVLVPTVGALDFRYGEPVPFAIAAIALAALAMQRGAPRLAALGAAAAMVEPHIGLPAVAALAALSPGSRRTLAAACAALAAVSVAMLGVPENVEYLTALLPAQARAELVAADQYSASRLAYLLGAAPGVATAIGTASYALATFVGVLAARRLARRLALPALVVLVPVATAMFGGAFVHDVEIAAAVPAAIVLARSSPLARAAVALLCMRWDAWWRASAALVAGAALGAAVVVIPGRASLARRALYAAGVTAAILLLARAVPQAPPASIDVAGAPRPAVRADDLSAIAWGWRLRLTPAYGAAGLATELAKIPTWVGLALVPLALLGPHDGADAGRRRRADGSVLEDPGVLAAAAL